MVAPKAPEGGWRRWFLDHPYQRTSFPILRSPSVNAAYYNYKVDEYGKIEPLAEPQFETVEMWWDSKRSQVVGELDGYQTWFMLQPEAPESSWLWSVEELFDHLMKRQKSEPTPPEPVGSGWDDFDWSI